MCGGVEWHVSNRHELRPLEIGLRLLTEVRALAPESFAWRPQPYEFVSDVPAIDLLTGSPRARAVVEGREEVAPLLADWQRYCDGFSETCRQFLLY